MALKKEQYDSIMNEYAGIRDRHRRELEKRRARAYARIPALRELEQQTPSLAVSLLRKRLLGDSTADASSFRGTAAEISQKRVRLLTENGFPPDYLDPTWDCPDCRDTGYIGREKCHCLKNRETTILYDQSNLEALTEESGFSGTDRRIRVFCFVRILLHRGRTPVFSSRAPLL